MPFRFLTKFGKSKKDVYEEIPGLQTEREIAEIVLEIIKGRRSVRKYKDVDISDEIVCEILDAARHAPSAGNQQPWEFIIIRDSEIKEQLVEACYNQNWMLQAPVLIVACINMKLASALYGERGVKLYGVQGVACAIQNLMLAAEALGLGTCWVGAFAETRIATIIRTPDFVRPCAIITVGWPAEQPIKPLLQDLEEIAHVERFGKTLLYKKIRKKKGFRPITNP